jgi:hypothetical protein
MRAVNLSARMAKGARQAVNMAAAACCMVRWLSLLLLLLLLL